MAAYHLFVFGLNDCREEVIVHKLDAILLYFGLDDSPSGLAQKIHALDVRYIFVLTISHDLGSSFSFFFYFFLLLMSINIYMLLFLIEK